MERRFFATLRNAGLTDETMELISSNKRLAEVVVSLVSDCCSRFERAALSSTHVAKRGPVSSVSPDDVKAAIEAIRRRGERISQAKVATELGKGSSYRATLSRTPELRAAYEDAVHGFS